jgi:6-pyruvoyl-tetrahydropterin synthase
MTNTFRDFTFRAMHHIPSKHGAAALPHSHTYTVRFAFSGRPDQDQLSNALQSRYKHLHGHSLNTFLSGATSDEDLAEWFLDDVQAIAPCVRVTVTNDFQRGAEASR